jgi:AcrR family transcriptional regulator
MSDEKQSFIAEARRAQIIEAAVATLDEIGYASASLAQIAKRARISTALISYHFRDKNDLMDQTLLALVAGSTEYILARTREAPTAMEKLHAYIVANLAYQGTHLPRYMALLEIIFHARTQENVPYYKIGDTEEEPDMRELLDILREGQRTGEFGEFNVAVVANAIRGAIGEYLLNPILTAQVSLEEYSAELVRLFDRALLTGKAGSPGRAGDPVPRP